MRHCFWSLYTIVFLTLTIQVSVTNHSIAQDNSAETNDVDSLLRRLAEIEEESEAIAGRTTGAHTDRLAVLFEQSNLATYQYTAEGVRYFVTRAILVNLSDEPLDLLTEEVVLLADGDELRLSEFDDQLKASSIYTGREYRRYEDIAAPDELSIPPGGTAAIWLMFSGLAPGPGVPDMKLRISIGDQTQEININEYQRGVLGFREERLGPDRCLALTTLTGELNTINAADFADELDRLAGQGVARVVISWGENAANLSQQVRGWLLASRTNQQHGQYNQMPVLPASIRELHFDRLPGDRDGTQPFIGQGVLVHADRASAVLAALRTAYQAIPRDELRRQVVTGPPLTRAAALTHGGSRLGSEDLPLVLRSMSDSALVVRRGAIAALAHFSEPAAIDALMSVVRGDSPDLSTPALEALASSRYPAAHSRLLDYLVEAPVAARTGIVNVLSRFPRPEWTDAVFSFTEDDDPELRLAAFRAIERIGHPRLSALIADALRDDDERIREFAFSRLAAAGDGGSEDAAMDYALTILESEPPNGTVTSLLSRTRDQRAIPLLLRHLDRPGDHRAGVIQLIARVAGHTAIDVLVDRFESFDQDDQAVTLEVLHELRAPQARGLALAAIRDRRHKLTPQATRILASDGDPQSIGVLADLLRSHHQQDWSWACNGLRVIGTREARQALLEARESDDANKRRYAADALRRLDMESPAHQVTLQGVARIQEQKFDEAEELFTLAIQFDDEYASAFSHRGFARLRLERVAEAQMDFEQAVEINPFDGQAVAGMAIAQTLQGRYLEGIRIVEENSPKFPDDPYYAYNSACVYGLALDQITDADPSDEVAARIQEYRVQAIILLKSSVDLDFNDWNTMRTDPDLDSLRDLDEFQELLRQIEPESEEPVIKQGPEERG